MHNTTIQVSGFITLKKFLLGRNLQQIERLLGFHKGRLRQGATFAELTAIPGVNEFDLAGYSQVANHRFDTRALAGYDINKLKNNVLEVWNKPGEKLVKVIATTGHNGALSNDVQYPPGSGVPQWKLIVRKQAVVRCVVNSYPDGVYRD